jgi:hypothetical protein
MGEGLKRIKAKVAKPKKRKLKPPEAGEGATAYEFYMPKTKGENKGGK